MDQQIPDDSAEVLSNFIATIETFLGWVDRELGASDPLDLPDELKRRLLAVVQRGGSPDQGAALEEAAFALFCLREGYSHIDSNLAVEHWENMGTVGMAFKSRLLQEALTVWRSMGRVITEQRDAWREEAWRCYCASGADPDGADARHLNPGEALAAVEEGRKDAEELADELERNGIKTGVILAKLRAEVEQAVLECSEGTVEGAAKAQKRLEALLR